MQLKKEISVTDAFEACMWETGLLADQALIITMQTHAHGWHTREQPMPRMYRSHYNSMILNVFQYFRVC